MVKLIDKYKHSYPIVIYKLKKFIAGIDKDRYLGRENLFGSLVNILNKIYGLLELK